MDAKILRLMLIPMEKHRVLYDEINGGRQKSFLRRGERNEIRLLPYTIYGNCRDIIVLISARECAFASKKPNGLVS
jgi:hypothetical protein